MKILRTDEEFRKSIYKILKSKPSYFYLSTFNISIDNEVKEILEQLKSVKNVKIIVGLAAPSFKQLEFLRRIRDQYCPPIILARDFHMKCIVSDNKAIIGGRNLTKSNWTDLSFEVDTKNNIKALKKEFENIYKKANKFGSY